MRKLFNLACGLCFPLLLLLPLAVSCSHSAPATSSSTLVSIVSESNPALPGPVTFFISVRAPGVAASPTGSVTFSEDSKPGDSVVLDGNGLAIFTVSLAPGSHEFSVSYGGDGNFAGAKSGSLTETVTNADGTAVAPKTTGAVVPTVPQETEVPVVD